jgi:hypothetical protein
MSTESAAMENATLSTYADATTQTMHILNDTASQFAMHSVSSASGLPLAVGIGFVLVGTNLWLQEGVKRMISLERVNG